MGHDCSIDRAIHFVFSSDDGFLRPLQIPGEIRRLMHELERKKPMVVVEIGTASGGNLFLFTRVATEDAVMVSIDLPYGCFGGGYGIWRLPLYKSFGRQRQKVHLLRADSHDPETLARLKRLLQGMPVDFLFIDGDHTYDGVKKDFEMYREVLAPGAMVAFHDIVEHSQETSCEVHRFWNDIKNDFDHSEIVHDPNAGFAGIGIIRSVDSLPRAKVVLG